MKAARRERYGSQEVIRVEELPVPTPREDELLVRVHAATVSRTDCALLSARPFIIRFAAGLFQPNIKTLGTDFSGQVQALGARVSGFSVGDRVWGMNDLGAASHAEYLVISCQASVDHMPKGASFRDAAACLEGAWYAYSFLERVRFQKGARVLINGATGAIGSALLQLCAYHDARVTAVGNAKNLELLRSLGASKVIDYEQTDFTQDGERYDYVFDAVGKSTFFACKHLLTPNGVYSSSEAGAGWQNLPLALVTPALAGRRVVFPIPVDRKRCFRFIRELVEAGRFRAVIDRTLTLDEISDAYAYAASGQKTGCVVLALADS